MSIVLTLNWSRLSPAALQVRLHFANVNEATGRDAWKGAETLLLTVDLTHQYLGAVCAATAPGTGLTGADADSVTVHSDQIRSGQPHYHTEEDLTHAGILGP